MVGQMRSALLLIFKALATCLLNPKVALQGIPVFSEVDKTLDDGFIAHLCLMMLAELCLYPK